MLPEELVNDALFAASQLIDWNGLELFGSLVPLTKEFLQPAFKRFRVNAMQCLHAIVHKGMDYPAKIQMIKELQFLETLNEFKLKFADRTADNYDELDAAEEEEFFECIAEAVKKLGGWCLELY